MSTAIQTVPPVLQRQVVTLAQEIQDLVIRTPQDYQIAASLSARNTEVQKQIDATFDPIIRKAHEAHREALAQKQKFSTPLKLDRQALDRKMLGWSSEQEKLRRVEEDRLRQIAKKEQDDQAIREAEELQRQGETKLADVVLNTAANSPAPVIAVPTSVPKVEGFAKRVNWRWRIKNAALIPREYMMPNEIAISGVVRSLKDKTSIPGVEVYAEDSAIHR